jgi:hypothetical protein
LLLFIWKDILPQQKNSPKQLTLSMNRLGVFVGSLIVFSSLICGAEPKCKPIDTPVTFQKIQFALEGCQIHTIEELLPLLPAEFRSRFVLVYSSRSLQGASPRYPRVILFGLDAKLILAFTGSPDLEGYGSLETIEFDDTKKSFNFRRIQFPSETDPSGAAFKPLISETNPEKCRICHREEPRPNWDTYAAWPGVFGSLDDGMPGEERTAYKNFLQNMFMKAGRYRHLEDAAKYSDSSRFYDYYPYGRANLQFTFLLSLLNGQSIAREIKLNSKLYPFRYALLSSLGCPDDFHDPDAIARLIPPEISSTAKRSYGEIAASVTSKVESSYQERETRQRNILNDFNSTLPVANSTIRYKPRELCCVDVTSRFQYVMELANVPFPQWSLELGSKNDVFFAGELGQMGELGLFLWQELLDPTRDGELYNMYRTAWEHRTDRGQLAFKVDEKVVCEELQKKSLSALALK